MIGMLYNKKADLAVEWIGATYDRLAAADFSFPYYIDEFMFVVSAPGLISKRFFFTFPFTPFLWLTFFASMALFSCVLVFIQRLTALDNKRWYWSLIEEIAFTAITILGQGDTKRYRGSGSNLYMMLSFAFISRCTLMFSYSAVLLSFLMVPLREPAIRTQRDLENFVLHKNYHVMVHHGSSTESVLMNAVDGATKSFGDYLRNHPQNRVTDFLGVISQNILTQNVALFYAKFPYKSYLSSMPRQIATKFKISEDSVSMSPISIAFRKGFPDIAKFTKIVIRMHDSGLNNKLIDDLLFENQLRAQASAPPVDIEDGEHRALTLSDLEGVLYLLLIGYTASMSDFFQFDSNMKPVGGMEFERLKILSQALDFSYTVIRLPEKVWGGRTPDGNWTGMIGMLYNKKADLAVEWIGATEDRLTAVDFSFPYYIEQFIFVVTAPGLISKRFFFAFPFTPFLWLTIFASLTLFSCVVVIIQRLTAHNNRHWFWSLIEEIAYTTTSILGQGDMKRYRGSGSSLYMMLSLWSIMRITLVFSYSAVLLSFLMVPIREPAIRTQSDLENLVLRKKYQVMVHHGSSTESLLMNAVDGAAKSFGDYLRKHPQNLVTGSSFEDIIRNVLTQNLAFFYTKFPYRSHAGSLSRQTASKLKISEDSISMSPISVAFRKGFRDTAQFNKIIIRMHDSGLNNKLIEDQLFEEHLRAPADTEEKEDRALTLSDLEGVLYLLVIGHTASVTCLGIEIICKKYVSKKQ